MSVDAPELPFRELIDAAPDGVIVCDQTGAIVLVNAETERMFGYSRDELVGQRIEALIPERVRPKDAGFYRYLTKPVKVAELTRTLEELLVKLEPVSPEPEPH